MATKTQNGATDEATAAVVSEAMLADRARDVRAELTVLTPELFARLLPLLREPIPAGFIKTVGKVEGKPYESTGIRSVQVQIDRMDSVLSPLWWREDVEYFEQGKLAKVTVEVGMPDAPMFRRSSYGGGEPRLRDWERVQGGATRMRRRSRSLASARAMRCMSG